MTTDIVANKTNTLAIVGIILGGIGVLGIGLIGALNSAVFGLAGVVVGFIALNQIKKSGEKGRGLAIIGIILGFLPFLTLVVLMVLGPIIGDVFNNINSSLTQ